MASGFPYTRVVARICHAIREDEHRPSTWEGYDGDMLPYSWESGIKRVLKDQGVNPGWLQTLQSLGYLKVFPPGHHRLTTEGCAAALQHEAALASPVPVSFSEQRLMEAADAGISFRSNLPFDELSALLAVYVFDTDTEEFVRLRRNRAYRWPAETSLKEQTDSLIERGLVNRYGMPEKLATTSEGDSLIEEAYVGDATKLY